VKTIWKYPLNGTDARLAIPGGAKILHVDQQADVPTLWAEVDPASPTVSRTFRVIGTGQPFPDDWPDDRWDYLGTAIVMSDRIVLHVYEVNGPAPAGGGGIAAKLKPTRGAGGIKS
jgi:hypothetical protein